MNKLYKTLQLNFFKLVRRYLKSVFKFSLLKNKMKISVCLLNKKYLYPYPLSLYQF